MKTLIALGLMTISMNTAFAADNSYADTRVSKGEEVKAERVETDFTLEGRNDASNGGIKFQKNVDQDQAIQLTGRRD
ncbi:hypothetical protein AB6D66_18360 [Vibrio pomeroyi]|uniref:Uncharacterized protein n=1 Tax=Vibrio pomeroyi TaxID=198832 RepID=A0ABV4N0K4_9VIBR